MSTGAARGDDAVFAYRLKHILTICDRRFVPNRSRIAIKCGSRTVLLIKGWFFMTILLKLSEVMWTLQVVPAVSKATLAWMELALPSLLRQTPLAH